MLTVAALLQGQINLPGVRLCYSDQAGLVCVGLTLLPGVLAWRCCARFPSAEAKALSWHLVGNMGTEGRWPWDTHSPGTGRDSLEGFKVGGKLSLDLHPAGNADLA